MKNSLLIISLILGFISLSFAGENDPLTTTSYTKESRKLFKAFKAIPISLPIAGQTTASAILLQSKAPSNNWLFLYHDRWGITETVIKEAHTLWVDLKNVNVLIIDLNDGVQPQSRSEAMRLLITNDVDRDRSIIKSAINYAGTEAKIGSLGWCNGGSWSLQTAIIAKEQEVACVVYYGMPDFNTSKLKTIQSDVLAIYGTKDTYITPTIAIAFKSKMLLAGKNVITLNYEGKGNFADINSLAYNYQNASDAYTQVLKYLLIKFD